jgi:hypothetical protein
VPLIPVGPDQSELRGTNQWTTQEGGVFAENEIIPWISGVKTSSLQKGLSAPG